MLKLPLFGTPVVAVINHLLSRQPALAAKLATHAGKVAAIDTGVLQLALCVSADGLLQDANEINVERGVAAAANVTIRINPADLPQILADMSHAFTYVNISGDAEFAKTIADVANRLHWDAEEDLAPLVGDIAAVRLVRAGRDAAEVVKTGSRKLVENLAEYLLEENPTLLYRAAGQAFASDVAVLRDDVERMAKRIALLDKQSSSTGGTQ